MANHSIVIREFSGYPGSDAFEEARRKADAIIKMEDEGCENVWKEYEDGWDEWPDGYGAQRRPPPHELDAIEQHLNRLFEEGRPIPAVERLDLCDQILALPEHERVATIAKKFMYLNVHLDRDPNRWSTF